MKINFSFTRAPGFFEGREIKAEGNTGEGKENAG